MVPLHREKVDGRVSVNLRRLCVVGLILTSRVLGQQAPGAGAPSGRVPSFLLPPGRPVAKEIHREGHETESETIAKCLQDYDGGDLKLRRRAILILGKYADGRAQQALVRALGDDDAVVRQSALVSLSEKPTALLLARKPLLLLLKDPDVHIRRIASSQLGAVFGGGLSMIGPPLIRARPARGVRDQEEAALLNAALADKDAIVRKNVLALHPYVGTVFDPTVLSDCLRDEDREVRVIAVQAYAAAPRPGDSGPGALAELVSDPDAIVRREVVRVLGAHGTEAASALLKLAQDADSIVRCEAVRLLSRIEDPKAFALLKGILAETGVPVDERCKLLREMVRFPEQSEEVLLSLAQSGPVTMRAEALQVLGMLPGSNVPMPVFLRLADDPSSGVRRAAVRVLLSRAKELTPDQVRELMASGHVDVRRSALALLAVLPPEEGAELIADGLLDEDIGIRRDAIRLAYTRRIPDWQQLLADSLLDENIEIRRMAADVLVRSVDPVGRRAVSEFLQSNEDPELATYMRQLFLGRQHPVRSVPSPASSPTSPPLPPEVRRSVTSPGLVPSRPAGPAVQPAVPLRPAAPAPRFPYQRRRSQGYRRPTYTTPKPSPTPAPTDDTKPGQAPRP